VNVGPRSYGGKKTSSFRAVQFKGGKTSTSKERGSKKKEPKQTKKKKQKAQSYTQSAIRHDTGIHRKTGTAMLQKLAGVIDFSTKEHPLATRKSDDRGGGGTNFSKDHSIQYGLNSVTIAVSATTHAIKKKEESVTQPATQLKKIQKVCVQKKRRLNAGLATNRRVAETAGVEGEVNTKLSGEKKT